MSNTKVNKGNEEHIRAVKCWLFSFVVLAIAAVLFVFCFIFESTLWLYVLCAVIFALFVLLYIRADKAIRHKDGYTLIQAMKFYLVCVKAGISEKMASNERESQILELTNQVGFPQEMKYKQIEKMYVCGQELVTHFGFGRFSKYV